MALFAGRKGFQILKGVLFSVISNKKNIILSPFKMILLKQIYSKESIRGSQINKFMFNEWN